MRVVLACLLLCACSNNKSPEKPAAPPPKDDSLADLDREIAAEKANARLEKACHKSMRRLSKCFVEDSRQHLGKDTYNGYDLNLLGEAHFRQFKTECMKTKMSKRQVEIYEVCNDQLPCDDYKRCLQRAEKGRTDTADDIRADQAPAANAAN